MFRFGHYHRHQYPLIGRDAEREHLRFLLSEAVAGHGTFVLVSGEAGIGKSSLVADLAQQADSLGVLVLTGGCYDLTTTPPYGPWSEILFQHYQSDDGLPPLPDVLLDQDFPSIGNQGRLFTVVTDFIAAVAIERPLVLVLEDLHWSDQASLDYLRYLARQLADSPLLLVATYRDDEITRRHALYKQLPALVRESRAERISLSRLDEAETRDLIRGRYALPPGDEERLTSHIWQLAEGNPFFTGELLYAMESEQVLRRSGDGWTLGKLRTVAVPPMVRQMLDGRLEQLDRDARELVDIAAVIGQRVPVQLWQAVSEADSGTFTASAEQAVSSQILTQLPGEPSFQFIHALLREAYYEDIVLPRRLDLHLKIAETLSALPDAQPEAVAYHFLAVNDPRAVDWLIQAGDRAFRLYAWRDAADYFKEAVRLLQFDAAKTQLRAWLLYRIGRMLRTSDSESSFTYLDEAHRLAEEINDPVLLAYSTYDRGFARGLRHDYRGAIADGQAAIDMLDTIPDDYPIPLQELRIWIADVLPREAGLNSGKEYLTAVTLTPRFTRTGTLVQWLNLSGRTQPAIALGEDYLKLVADQDIKPVPVEWSIPDVFTGLGMAAALSGRPRKARSYLTQSINLLVEMDHYTMAAVWVANLLGLVVVPYFTEDLKARAEYVALADNLTEKAYGSRPVWMNTDRDRRTVSQQRVDFIEGNWKSEVTTDFSFSFSNPSPLTFQIAAIEADLARYRGNTDRAWEMILHSLPGGLATDKENAAHLYSSRIQLTAIELSLDAGDLEQALAWLEMMDDWQGWSGAKLWRAEYHLSRSRYLLLSDAKEAAEREAHQALKLATTPRQPLALLAAHRWLGCLAIERKEFDAAAGHLNESVQLADTCRAPFELALTLIELARLQARTEHLEEARETLAEVRTICEPLDAALAIGWVVEVEEWIDERAGQIACPAGLTPREMQVLHLAATGLTDRAIAEQLFISPRTVGQHLRNVYSKIGVNSRTAAALWAAERGLV